MAPQMRGDNDAQEQAKVTMLLKQINAGDAKACEDLAPLVYSELRRRAQQLMRREGNAQSMQATMLVNDAFMQLIDAEKVDWESRKHFFALASRVMRRVLVDRARSRRRDKRGGDAHHESLDKALMVSAGRDDDVLRIEEALKSLAKVEPRHAEIVTMRFFGGLGIDEIAEALETSKRSIEREWTLIKAWLRRELAS